jgi:hypothetical protein
MHYYSAKGIHKKFEKFCAVAHGWQSFGCLGVVPSSSRALASSLINHQPTYFT